MHVCVCRCLCWMCVYVDKVPRSVYAVCLYACVCVCVCAVVILQPAQLPRLSHKPVTVVDFYCGCFAHLNHNGHLWLKHTFHWNKCCHKQVECVLLNGPIMNKIDIYNNTRLILTDSYDSYAAVKIS